MKKQYTPLQRLKIYKKVLEHRIYLKRISCHLENGICFSMYQACWIDIYYDDNLQLFPELLELYKRSKGGVGMYWFKDEKQRMGALKRVITKLEKQLTAKKK